MVTMALHPKYGKKMINYKEDIILDNETNDKKENKRQVPLHLSHKPIYYINGYKPIDGEYKNNTDVVGLSLGKAQWSEEFIPSLKVWRYKYGDGDSKGRWSRQSEEVTVTRALDMATLFLKVYNSIVNGMLLETFDGPNVYGKVNIEHTEQHELIKALQDYFTKHQEDIDSHIKLLKDTLNKSKI